MSNEIFIKLDDEWFCIDCRANHHCINCPVMDELLRYKSELLEVVEGNIDDKTEKKGVYCGCWTIMKKSNFDTWPAYWCPKCKWR